MSANPEARDQIDPDTHLTDVQVARLLGLSCDHLRRLRSRSEGPPFRKLLKSAVRYRRGDVLAWAAAANGNTPARAA